MSQISENDINYSQKVSNRMIELINQNKLNYSNELQIIAVLFQKYELISISDYATKICKSYNGVLDMIEREKVAIIEISGKTLILNNLN